MKALLLYGLAFALMAVGFFILALAGTLGLYLLELSAPPPTGVLIIIVLVALGYYGIVRGAALYKTLGLFYKLKSELRHEIFNTRFDSRPSDTIGGFRR